jgi:predicted amidohydrolase YtcJ
MGIALCLLALSPAAAQFTGPGEEAPVPAADLIVENAHIRTPEGWANALAVANGTIVAIGDKAAVERFRTGQTEVFDAQGGTVVPGLYDMHVHPMGAGANARACAIPHGAPPAKVLETIAGCARDKQPGQWITGNGHDNASFGDTPPTKEMLDRIATDKPMLFFDISGHSTWANSAALALAGIDRDTPNPPGGIIERDSNGEPTGVLREAASRMVWSKIPGPTREENRAALQWGLERLLAHGVTSFDDAGLGEAGALAYADLADAGLLKQRVRGCIMVADKGLLERRALYARDRFSPTCVKIMLDGVPTDGHTAAMVEPYVPSAHHHGEEGRETGLLMIPPPELNEMVTRFDAMGLTVKFHAAGDAAVRAGLDAIAAARKANGLTGNMHNVGHSSFVQLSDAARASSIAATFEFSPFIWFPSPITVDIRKAVGDERMKRWIPVRDAIEAGAQAVPGSDWPVTPTANPWIGLETLVTRQVPGGTGEKLGGQESIGFEQAFDMFTAASARNQNMLAMTGTLEPGKLADFIVLDRNVFEVPVTTVHDTRVLYVFIDGEQVYQADPAV